MRKHSIMLIYIITMAVLSSSLFTGCKGGSGSTDSPPASQSNGIEKDIAIEKENNTQPADKKSPAPTLSTRYFDKKSFMASVASVSDKETDTPASSGVIGGIVPHHLLAGNMIAEFFYQISLSSPNTLIVLGPNHRKLGTSGIHTSKLDWGTAFGILEANSDIAEDLVKNFKALENTTLMEEEHSVSSLVPYIKYYMPDVKIVPILLHGNNTKQESVKLGKKLSEFSSGNPGVVIIASVDFSHYLNADTAKKMDEITLEAIKSNDIDSIYAMGNDNLDSPPSIITLLTAMGDLNSSGLEILGHGVSSDITGIGADYTTSYFTILFNQ